MTRGVEETKAAKLLVALMVSVMPLPRPSVTSFCPAVRFR
jgi:hypothetical protein